ncbi:MAG: PGF-CTERM sorting domain-containing protein [Candidatus Poseidoniales archaeon]|nr:PGF-CTERM sorting domain-containing protein [Candidatus Poseidoniales archaeon]
MEQNMKTFGVILATLAMIASVLVMPVASAEDGDLQATISGDDGTTSFASENGTAVFTVEISSASDAAHTNVNVSVAFESAGWESDQASIDDCAGGLDFDFTVGESSTVCISVMVMGSESIGGDIGMSVNVTSDDDPNMAGKAATGQIKITNWIAYSNDGVQSYSENETNQYTITVENIMLDADGAGVDLDEPVQITFVGTSGGWNIDSSSPAWDKPSLTATINFIPADGSFDLVLDIQLVGQIELSSSYTGDPGTIVFNAFDSSCSSCTTLISLYAEIATFNAVTITSSSDDTDVWDASTTQVDNGCTNIDAAIAFDISVFNHGNDRDSFDVTFDTSNAGGWTVTGIDPFTTTSLEPKKYDGVESFSVGFLIPSGLAAGTTHSFSMTATSTTDDSISQTQTFSATIKQCYQFDLSVDSMMNSANPGSSTDFTFTVSNTGNGDDTFTYMAMGAAAWNPSLASVETEIASGATGQNVLSVTVPADASSDAVSGMIMVHAYSEACGDNKVDCDFEASKTVSVSANQVFDLAAGYYSNETDVVKSSASVEEGMSVQMKVTVTNNGNGIDQVTLSLANAPSWVSISDDPILVGPGLTETISITAMAPSGTGDFTFQVTATSSDDTVTSTTGDLTITITEKGAGTGPTTEDVEEDDSPGFGALSAIAALGAVLLLRRRS